MTKPVLELVKISKTFSQDLLKAKHKALMEVSCSFPKHTATAVMGHNGAGKTTSIRTILGLLRPDCGEILFEGRPIKNEDRRRMGYMPEINKLPGELRSEELLYFHLNLYKPQLSRQEKQELVDAKLTEVGLMKKHKQARIRHLSKGLARRLGWAMASIHDPELLILDEPFTGMDPLGRMELSAWMKDSVESAKSLLMITHDLQAAKALCSRLLVFREGRVVYEGSTQIPDEQILEYFRGVL